MRRIAFACCLFLVIETVSLGLRAQQPSSTGGDVFAGQDPLTEHALVMPESSLKTCYLAGSNGDKLLAHQNGTCYYVQTLSPPINGYITSINNVGILQKFYVSCGTDQFDATKVVCQNPGDNLPGAKPTAGPPAASGVSGTGPNGEVFAGGDSPAAGGPGDPIGGPTSSTGNLRRIPVQVPSDPCHPNYNTSTPAGRAAAQQNAQRDAAACNQERCKHNPQLQVCVNIDERTPGTGGDPGGAKGFNITPTNDGPQIEGQRP